MLNNELLVFFLLTRNLQAGTEVHFSALSKTFGTCNAICT